MIRLVDPTAGDPMSESARLLGEVFVQLLGGKIEVHALPDETDRSVIVLRAWFEGPQKRESAVLCTISSGTVEVYVDAQDLAEIAKAAL